MVDNKPILFNLSIPEDRENYDQLLKDNPTINIIDTFDEQICELSEVINPASIKNKGKQELSTNPPFVWVYYPWKNTLVKILNEKDYEMLRLSRNEPLITKEEQERFQNSSIAFAGLNVGNPGALCMVLEGGPKKMKFADFDHLSLSNLNRFRAGICELGMNKAILSARQSYEVTPYLDIELFESGLSDENCESFLSDPQVDLLVEEVDNLPLKIKLREDAKKKGIPVLMVTGNGSNVVIDIERYDQDKDLEILNGHLKAEVVQQIAKLPELDFSTVLALMRDFMGSEFLTKRLVDSFPLVGEKYAGIPQLSEATFLRGAVLSYFSRKILNPAENIPSGRFKLGLDDVIN